MKLDKTKLQEIVEKIAYQQTAEEQSDDLFNKMGILNEYVQEQLILSGVSDIVHRAELKVLENVSDYIPCEIYSQAIIFSQKKRDNVR